MSRRSLFGSQGPAKEGKFGLVTDDVAAGFQEFEDMQETAVKWFAEDDATPVAPSESPEKVPGQEKTLTKEEEFDERAMRKRAIVNFYLPDTMDAIRQKYQNLDWAEVQKVISNADSSFFTNDVGGFSPMKIPHARISRQKTNANKEEESEEAAKLDKLLKHKFKLLTKKRSYKFKGGVRESYSCLVLAGTGKGIIGWGLGKSATSKAAAQRARRAVVKHLIHVPLCEDRTFYQDVIGQHNQTFVILKKASRDHGLTACPMLKAVCSALGVLDGTTKIIGRRNPMSVLYAIFNALSQQRAYRDIALDLGRNYYHYFDPSQVRERPPTWAELQNQAAKNLELVRDAKNLATQRQGYHAKLAQGLPTPIPLADVDEDNARGSALDEILAKASGPRQTFFQR